MPLVKSILLFGAWTAAVAAEDNVQLGLRLPAGFQVTQFAGPELANDIFSLTIDPHGRIVVSGRGYIRILVDDDQDGRADRSFDFADGPSDGAQGLLWEDSSLYITGEGGLRRYRDEDRDGRADGPSELIRAIKTGGEHDAHDIKRGPDGWLYVLCGNMAGINGSFADLPTSPIRDPVAGCLIRFAPDLKSSEIVADGFRNAYRMDFSSDGELFTYDSDNERCVALPWYEPTRFYHVITGGHYGWLAPQRAQFWRLPPYFPDVVAPAAYLGRGSPTGVACYRHGQFPQSYRGGIFAADWTFGRVYFLPLERRGASFSSEPQVFLDVVGDNGFAPTDLCVHPATGDLFVSIGGRGTRGAVYRIRYPAGVRDLAPSEMESFRPRPPRTAEPLIRHATTGDPAGRLAALGELRRERLRVASDDIRAAVLANWQDDDRYVRNAAAALIDTMSDHDIRKLKEDIRHPTARATYAQGTVRTDALNAIMQALLVLDDDSATAAARMAAVRVLQLAIGDVGAPESVGTIWEGYSLRTRTSDRQIQTFISHLPIPAKPSGDAELDREIARTHAMIGDGSALDEVATRLTEESSPMDDVHYLAVLARLGGRRPQAITSRVALTLLQLDRKIARWNLNRDRNWSLRISELFTELAKADPDLKERMVTDPEFGRSDHVLYAQCPGFDRRRAAQAFLARSKADADFVWNAALVELLGSVPDFDSAEILRGLWENLGLRDVIVLQLARDPQAEDREKFLDALNSPQLATVDACLNALEKLPTPDDATELLTLVRAMRRLRGGKEEDRLRDRVGNILQRRTSQSIAVSDADGWTTWLAQTHPELAERLGGPDGVDVAAWKARLDPLDWSAGDADRGRAIYERTGCIACHSAARAMGPDLRGVTNRFSRDDLFTAILQPSRDVSPRYQTTLVSTSDGKVYQGTIIYEAVDSLILQTGADTTIRITNNQIIDRRVTSNSLMPAGLLDKLTDREIADLLAHLKSLQ